MEDICRSFVGLPPQLQEIFPENYKYYVDSFEELSPEIQPENCDLFDKQIPERYKTTVRLPICKVNEARAWIDQFKSKSKLNFVVHRTFRPEKTFRILLKVSYRCKHNSRNKYSVVHTQCPASLQVKVMKQLPSKRWDKDNHLPMIIILENIHNHCFGEDYLRHLPVSTETESRFRNLFEKGYTASEALNMYKAEIKAENPDTYKLLLGDRSIVPDKKWCYNLHAKMTKPLYGNAEIPFLGNLISPPKKMNTVSDPEETNYKDSLKMTVNIEPVVSINEIDIGDQSITQRTFQAVEKYEAACQKVVCLLKKNPSEFLSTIEMYNKKFESLTSSSALCSAIQCFARYNDSEDFDVSNHELQSTNQVSEN